VSPAGTVAHRLMVAVGVRTREQAREFVIGVVQRQVPRLSLADVRELLDPTLWPERAVMPEQRKTEVFDPGEMPPRGTVRDNLAPGEVL
jgi:hypothetical protein